MAHYSEIEVPLTQEDIEKLCSSKKIGHLIIGLISVFFLLFFLIVSFSAGLSLPTFIFLGMAFLMFLVFILIIYKTLVYSYNKDIKNNFKIKYTGIATDKSTSLSYSKNSKNKSVTKKYTLLLNDKSIDIKDEVTYNRIKINDKIEIEISPISKTVLNFKSQSNTEQITETNTNAVLENTTNPPTRETTVAFKNTSINQQTLPIKQTIHGFTEDEYQAIKQLTSLKSLKRFLPAIFILVLFVGVSIGNSFVLSTPSPLNIVLKTIPLVLAIIAFLIYKSVQVKKINRLIAEDKKFVLEIVAEEKIASNAKMTNAYAFINSSGANKYYIVANNLKYEVDKNSFDKIQIGELVVIYMLPEMYKVIGVKTI